MFDEKIEKIHIALAADDDVAFENLTDGVRYKALRFGRFPLLSLCYLYGSEKIIKRFEHALLKVEPDFAVEEKFDDYLLFRQKAGKALRLYAFSDAVVTPLEMLALLKKSQKLAELYDEGYKDGASVERIKSIYSLRHSSKINANVKKISIPVGSASKREKLLLSLMAVFCVFVIAFSSFLPSFFSSKFGNGSQDSPYSVMGSNQFSDIATNRSAYIEVKSDIDLASVVKGRLSSGKIDGNGNVIKLSEGFSGSISTEYSGDISDVTFLIDTELSAPVITSFSGTMKNVSIIYGQNGSGKFSEVMSGSAENLTVKYTGNSTFSCFDTVSGTINGLNVEYSEGSGVFCGELSGEIKDIDLTFSGANAGSAFIQNITSEGKIDGGKITFDEGTTLPAISTLSGSLSNLEIEVNDYTSFIDRLNGSISSSSVTFNAEQQDAFIVTADFSGAANELTVDYKAFSSAPFIQTCALQMTSSTVSYKNGLNTPFVSVLYGSIKQTVFNVDAFSLATDKDFSVVAGEVGVFQYGFSYAYGALDDVNVNLEINVQTEVIAEDGQDIENYVSVFAVTNNGNISNCSSFVNITARNVSGKDLMASGLVGRNNRNISACSVDEGSEIVGISVDLAGICGINSGTVSASVNNAALSQSSASESWNPNVAGICNLNGGTISSCVNNGKLSLFGEYDGENTLEHVLGGIVNKNYSQVVASTNNGALELSAKSGYVFCSGITSVNYNLVNYAYSDGDISVESSADFNYVGGIIAYSVKNSSLSGSPQAGNSVCLSNIKVQGSNEEIIYYIGGICGYNYFYLINSYASCVFDVEDSGTCYLGAVIGLNGVNAVSSEEYPNGYVKSGDILGVGALTTQEGVADGTDENCAVYNSPEEMKQSANYPFKEE